MQTSLVISIVSAIFGLAGICIALIMYVYPRKRTRFVYQTVVVRYFDQSRLKLPRQAAMTFDGRQVERLAKTTIVLWNAGTEVLRGEDIVDTDPIRFAISGGRLLSKRVAKAATSATKVSITGRLVDNELEFCYSHLNPGDGAVVELIHDGATTSVTGIAKGLKDGPEDWGDFSVAIQPLRTWLQGGVLQGVAMALLIVGTWILVSVQNGEPSLHGDFSCRLEYCWELWALRLRMGPSIDGTIADATPRR